MALFGRETRADVERARRVREWAQARSPFALAAVMLGILAVLDFFTLVLGVLCGIGAIVLGVLALRALRRRPQLQGRRLAVTGLALGLLGLAASGVFYLVIDRGLGR